MPTTERSKDVTGVAPKSVPNMNRQTSQLSGGKTMGKSGGSRNGMQGSNMSGSGNAQMSGTANRK